MQQKFTKSKLNKTTIATKINTNDTFLCNFLLLEWTCMTGSSHLLNLNGFLDLRDDQSMSIREQFVRLSFVKCINHGNGYKNDMHCVLAIWKWHIVFSSIFLFTAGFPGNVSSGSVHIEPTRHQKDNHMAKGTL